MAVRGFEYYGQTVAQAVVPPFVAPAAPPATAPTRSPYMERVMRMPLFFRSTRLGLYALTLLLLGQILAVTWIGQVTGEDNMLLWLSAISAGNIVAGVLTLLAVRAGVLGGRGVA